LIATDDLPCMRVLTTACSRLTVRLPEEQVPTGWLPPRANPLRVLLDARGRVTGGPLLETALAPTLVFTTAASRGNAARAAWAAAGVEVFEVAAETQAAGASANGSGVSVGAGSDGGDGVALGAVLDELGARGIIQLMVEGGGAVHGAFLSTPGLAQQLRLYIGATALGSTSRRWIQAPIASTINEAPRWKLLDLERLGEDVCVDYALE
jgi:riboflavin biosynthesis pyrimidine reductase